jgi:probable O-glycosylation ligase (exosortase A-associated)
MHPRRGKPVPSDGAPPWKSASNWVFYGYLLVILLEFSGLPNQYPFLKQLRLTTLLSYSLLLVTISQVGFGDVFKHRQTKVLLFFLVFTILSMLWAVVKLRAYQSIRPFVDYLVFFYLTLSLVERPRRFELFCWTFLCVSSYLVSQNLSRLGQEVRAGSFAAPYFMGDGNDFAWGLAVMLPFVLYLFLAKKSFVRRIIAIGGIAVILLGIVGTSSRGGSLGVIAAVLFYWWFMSARKGLGVAVMILGLVGVLMFAPATYTSRMGSLSDTSEDTSAQARLTTWKASMKMAIDYPLGVGAGNFSSAYGRFYLGGGNLGYAQNKWFSAHSIYFRTLGEYGYLGVGLLIWLIVTNIVDGLRIRAKMLPLADKAPLPVMWPSVVCMSIVAYAICGIFLGGLAYPHLFMLSGLTLVNKRLAGMGIETTKGRFRPRAKAPAAPIAGVDERKA